MVTFYLNGVIGGGDMFSLCFSCVFQIFYSERTSFFKILFIFREGKWRRKRGRETSMCGYFSLAPYWGPGPATQACALTGN